MIGSERVSVDGGTGWLAVVFTHRAEVPPGGHQGRGLQGLACPGAPGRSDSTRLERVQHGGAHARRALRRLAAVQWVTSRATLYARRPLPRYGARLVYAPSNTLLPAIRATTLDFVYAYDFTRWQL